MHIGGQGEELQQSINSLLFAFGLAIFLVYLVMASQFESLLHPFVILFTIPLALVGAVLALLLTNSTISVVVFIGLILLVGLVVKNAIILIDKVNQLREHGVAKREALIEGARSRLRPIIMLPWKDAAQLPLDGCPRLTEWYARIEALPAWRQPYPDAEAADMAA